MSMIFTVRKSLGMNQQQFGQWLASQVNRSEPFPVPRISEYEHCKVFPNSAVRMACAAIAASVAAKEIWKLKKNDSEWLSKVERLIIDSQS